MVLLEEGNLGVDGMDGVCSFLQVVAGRWLATSSGAGVVALPRPVDGRAPRRRGSGTLAFFTDRPESTSSCGLLDILLGPEMTWSRTKRMVQPQSMAVSMNIKIRQWEWHFDFCLTARR